MKILCLFLTIYFYNASNNVQFNPKLLERKSKNLPADPIQILFEREKERKGVFLPSERKMWKTTKWLLHVTIVLFMCNVRSLLLHRLKHALGKKRDSNVFNSILSA